MTRTWLPQSHYLPWGGQYLATYRWYREQSFTQVPGRKLYPTVGQAKAAADDFLANAMNKQIRGTVTTEPCDVLGIAAWHEQKAAQRAAEQEQALGAIVVRSKTVIVERKRMVKA